MSRPSRTLVVLGLLVILAGSTGSVSGATDAPIVRVQAGRLVPARLAVHVGEVVTWRAADGQPLRLALDPRPSGHEVVRRPGEVRAYFREPGDHGYTVTIGNGSGQSLRGAVSVSGAQIGREPLLSCGPESSGRICFEP